MLDVVVVGAGLAGLTCARLLARGGHRVRVLEARDRVGGRTWSMDIGRGRFDVGGQWLGPTQNRVASLASELGVETFPTFHGGTKVLLEGERMSTYRGSIPKLPIAGLLDLEKSIRLTQWLARQVDPGDPLAWRGGRRLDRVSLGGFLARTMWSERARALFATGIRIVFGAEPEELSALWVMAYAAAGGGLMRLIEIENGAQQDRFVQGAQALSLGLARDLDRRVTLDAPVDAIVTHGDSVEVVSGLLRLQARRAVVAVPPALAARIAFEPMLPVARDQLVQRFPMGGTVKCFALYDRAFWRDAGFSGEVVCAGGPVSAVFDNTTHDGAQPCLLSFVVGRDARDWSSRDPAERRDAVLAVLARAFGPSALAPTVYEERDWCIEPWSRGCPTGTLAAGALSAVGARVIREPVGRVHWAGTETATVWTGYMEGAIESGERAAAEVSAALA